MRVFVTGASGWIGSATVDELLGAGHEVVGLARSDASAAALEAKGVDGPRGDLDDLEALRRGAADAEGVVHLANKHDWANPAESNRAERVAVETLGEALVGTGRPLVLAGGVAGLAAGRPGTEADPSPAIGPDSPRGGAENLAFAYVDRGVRAVSVRFAPTTHGDGDHGFIALITAAARRQGVSAYVGDGSTRWSAVHVSDAARLVRLGLEQAPAGTRLHAVAEDGDPQPRDRAGDRARVGRPRHLRGPRGRRGALRLHRDVLRDGPRRDQHDTRELFDWTPTGPTLLEDIDEGAYVAR